MRIGVLRETANGERRVALVPESVGRLCKAGLAVLIERGAGANAYCRDEQYAAAGAQLVDAATVLAESDIVLKVQRPSPDQAERIKGSAFCVSLFGFPGGDDSLRVLTRQRVTTLALERVPRITRAQSMDVLSSQATVGGYKAVLVGASHTAKLLPMLTTAAGNIPPAKAFVIGAGVAGLMAIATARRLGANVSGFDIRAAAREQVMSLGASFVGPEPSKDAEVAGGYARAQTDVERQQTMDALAAHIRDQDLVVTTAQIPGRPAPRLITRAMVESMKAGSVIVDMAAETGGNCEVTVAGETVDVSGVQIVGAVNLPSTVPFHASVMFSKNVFTLLQHMIKDGAVVTGMDDEIVGPMCLTHDGTART